jgi:hypothetical protein
LNIVREGQPLPSPESAVGLLKDGQSQGEKLGAIASILILISRQIIL